METYSFKKILTFFGIIAIIVFIFIVGLNYSLKFFEKDNKRNDILQQKQTEEKDSTPLLSPNIKNAEEVGEGPSIIYKNGAFSPSRFELDGSGGLGCFVLLLNQSGSPLKIGVSPHHLPNDPGSDFGVIEPSGKIIFDPRFPGIKELHLHNHDNPHEEFVIILSPKCQ